jgi:hypothetical protein
MNIPSRRAIARPLRPRHQEAIHVSPPAFTLREDHDYVHRAASVETTALLDGLCLDRMAPDKRLESGLVTKLQFGERKFDTSSGRILRVLTQDRLADASEHPFRCPIVPNERSSLITLFRRSEFGSGISRLVMTFGVHEVDVLPNRMDSLIAILKPDLKNGMCREPFLARHLHC